MKTYVLDDTFIISDEIKKMSGEESQQLARKLEEEGRKEKEKIMQRKDRKTLSVIWNIFKEMILMKKLYMEDDRIIEISEELRNMSEEEIDRQIAILEAEARREAENIPKPTLLAN